MTARVLTHPTVYRQTILSVLAMLGRKDVDTAHVEAYLRLAHGTLDGLTLREFAAEVRVAVDAIDEGGIDMADDLARSYGLASDWR